MYGKNQLLVIIKTVGPLGLALGPSQRRQKHSRKYRDNSNHD